MQVQQDVATHDPELQPEPPDRFDRALTRVERVAQVATKVAAAASSVALAGALVYAILTGDVTPRQALDAIPRP